MLPLSRSRPLGQLRRLGSQATVATTITYVYDKNDPLASACYGAACAGGSIAYTYDAAGNRTKLVDSGRTTSYSYEGADELTGPHGPSGATSYGYDTDGRRTSEGSTSYTYTAADELTKLTSGSRTTTHTYDGPGTRASAMSSGQTTNFACDISQPVPRLVPETNGGTTLRRYVWGDGLASMNSAESDYYVAHDAQGSIVALTSSSGTTESTFSYDPFGNQLSASSTAGAPTLSLRDDAE